ncbi:non-homologous end joining protein Ku [Pseudomonas japonica]|uniref:non-homologous end joining protein Ku n=1 Tax=Pseudomonas japonica TaxID=256466 RepID=UPI0015E3CB1F|nr:Ku protein [Pseudomonas japonica]MBA1242295.1 Ku protein [Pseudomonas japonica]
MPRAIWKGAVSFGLVHIPVALVSATASKGVDFDWLDKRSMDPVGYKRINKVSGEEMDRENIVKGVQYEKGRYVVLSEEEIRAAHPVSTQTIEIFSFVDSSQIPLPNIDTPYYLAPDKRGEKVYALLRETLRQTNKVALALVVLHTRQYLSALMPLDDALVLVKLRWPAEVRSLDTLELSAEAKKAELKKGELEMAKRLVEDMSGDWSPEEYTDQFEAKIMELVDRKAHEGKIEEVETAEDTGKQGADVIDLTELLKRSLGGKTAPKAAGKATEEKPATAKPSKSRTPRKSRKAS